MKTKLSRNALLGVMSSHLRTVPDKRNACAPNFKYPLQQAGMTALGVFYFQHGSIAAHEQALEQDTYGNNFRKLFFHEPIKCSQTIRNILDPIHPDDLKEPFSQVLKRLDRSGVLPSLRYSQQVGLLMSGDGVDYFSSTEVSCDNCSTAVHHRGEEEEYISYSHKMFNVGIVHPTENLFIPLAPEFITPQDGHSKQDCEQEAAKRWLGNFRRRHKHVRATLQVDNLHCNHEFLSLVKEHRIHFIATHKPKGNATVTEWVELAKQGGDLGVVNKRQRVKGQVLNRRYEYLCNIPIRDSDDALRVNYVAMTETNRKTGKSSTFAYITDHQVTDQTVESLAKAGRKRWKVENESHNTLKNHGYYFDHNYGHGKQHLSAIIATLIVYSFLIHSLLRMLGQDGFARLCQLHDARKRVMERLRNVLFIVPLKSWDHFYAIVLGCWDTS